MCQNRRITLPDASINPFFNVPLFWRTGRAHFRSLCCAMENLQTLHRPNCAKLFKCNNFLHPKLRVQGARNRYGGPSMALILNLLLAKAQIREMTRKKNERKDHR